MPFILAILGVFFPRVIIVILYFFTGWFARAFDGFIIPLIGFIFLPITTLWYAIAVTYFGGAGSTVGLIGIVVAVLLDLGVIGGSARRRA